MGMSPSLDVSGMIKICTKCKVEYRDAELHFKKDRTKSDGFYSSCKECNHKEWKENYPNIAEKHREKVKIYTKNNMNKYHRYQLKYYQNNKEELKEKAKEWRIANPDKRKLSHSKDKAYRRALLARVKNNLTAKDIRQQHKEQSGKCYYCKKEVGLNYHVDHVIPIAKGGDNTKDNIVIACPECNLAKGIKSVEEFINCRHRWDIA